MDVLVIAIMGSAITMSFKDQEIDAIRLGINDEGYYWFIVDKIEI